jgi:mono/diheme cytochrome c family protein
MKQLMINGFARSRNVVKRKTPSMVNEHVRIGIFLLTLAACSTQAAYAEDAENGLRLAQRWCASCHVVSADQKLGADVAPAFASIAKKTNFNAEKLAFFLLNPHPIMPNMSLTRDEAQDIAEYVSTLR